MPVNLSRNPTCANNVTDWVGPGWSRLTGQTVGTTGRTTCGRRAITAAAWPDIGTAGARLASTADIGKTYSYVAWVRLSVARSLMHALSAYNGTSWQAMVGDYVTVALAANTWTKIRGTGTVPSGITFDRIGVHSDFGTSGSAGNYDVAAVRIVEGADATIEFADGDTAGWVWDGTAGNSTSQEAVVTGPEPGRALLAA